MRAEMTKNINYSRLSYKERAQIETYVREGFSQAEISRKLGRVRSTIHREIRRCDQFLLPRKEYHVEMGEADSTYYSRFRVKRKKLDANPNLLKEVLCGLRKRWSPEQISSILRRKYPRDKDMQISHESIYTYIYILPRGSLRKELVSLLRQKKKTRYKRVGSNSKRGKIPEMISIEERPKHLLNRSIPGHWEGDLIIGRKHKSALGTLVERKTRTVLLVPIKNRKPSHVRKAFEQALRTLPKQMKETLTYDQGKEMSEHRLFTKNTKMKVYFCHPASPWERGTCENTNGLIRDYFPKNADFSTISKNELRKVQDQLNERPRKVLGFLTPKEVFEKEILK
jgi:transposase, IS30 family